MTNTIKLNAHDIERAFNTESGKLRNGEHSRFLPGFTALETVESYVTGLEEWKVWFVATRLRDGKTYGYEFTRNFYNSGFSSKFSSENVVFSEMVRKTYEVVYYEEAKK